jgi:hypothetical protein
MRGVRIEHLAEVAELADRLRSLMGHDTELYIEITKHPVWNDGELIGHFVWVEELEDVVFQPSKV